MNIIAQLEAEQAAKIEASRKFPDFSAGDTLRVQVRVTEGKRTRLQAFEGVCIARSGSGLNENFTVRKISYGEGVERVFPIYSPLVEAVEVVRRGKVRRAKLYYMRDRRGKSARIVENTGTRARKLNEAERQALAEENLPKPLQLTVLSTGLLQSMWWQEGHLVWRPSCGSARVPQAVQWGTSVQSRVSVSSCRGRNLGNSTRLT